MNNLLENTYIKNIPYFILSKTTIILNYGKFVNFQGNINNTHSNKFNISQTKIYEGIHTYIYINNYITKNPNAHTSHS